MRRANNDILSFRGSQVCFARVRNPLEFEKANPRVPGSGKIPQVMTQHVLTYMYLE